jgi:HEAT repeat protein
MTRSAVLCLGLFVVFLLTGDFAAGQSKKAAELIKGLSDKDPKGRISAAVDIGDLATVKLADAKLALPTLRNLWQRDPEPGVRKAALEALGKIDPEGYVGMLMDTFKKDKDQLVRLAVVAEFGRLRRDAKEALPMLYDAIKSPPEPVKATPMVVNPKAPPPPAPADPQAVRKAILPQLRQMEPDPKNYVPLLTETLKKDRDPGFRTAIVGTLGQLGPRAKEAVPVMQEVIKASLQESPKLAAMNPKDTTDPAGLRAAILQALGRIAPQPDEYLPVLLDVLKKDREPTVRQNAAAALARLGSSAKTAVPALHEAYKSSVAQSPIADAQGARRAMVEAIFKLDPEPKARLTVVLEVLKKDRDPAVLAFAAAEAGVQGAAAKSAMPLLREVQRWSMASQPMADPQGVRKAVLDAMAKIEPDAKLQVPVLIEVLQRDFDADVRLAALAALKKLGPSARSALPVLLELQRSGATAKDEREKSVALEAESVAKTIKAN